MTSSYSLEPVPEVAATRAAAAIAVIVINASMGVPIMILGASLGHDYGFGNAIAVAVVGGSAIAAMTMLTAFAGVRTRCTIALLAERAFGSWGANVLNFAVALALLGWFAVEMGFLGDLIAGASSLVFGARPPRWLGIGLVAGFVCFAAIRGISLISRAPVILVPILGAFMLWIALSAWPHLSSTAAPRASALPFGNGVSAIVGSYIVGCLIMPDYSRFVAGARGAVFATWLALGLAYPLIILCYALAGAVAGSSDPLALLGALGLPAIASLLLPVGLLQNGIMCLYSSALAASPILRRAPFDRLVVGIALVGVTFALLNVQSAFVGFLVALGVVFPPAAAIACAEALPGARARAQRPLPKIRWGQFGCWAAGSAFATASQFGIVTLTGISAVDGFLCTLAWVALASTLNNRAPTIGKVESDEASSVSQRGSV